jgi:hypothetical protein
MCWKPTPFIYYVPDLVLLYFQSIFSLTFSVIVLLKCSRILNGWMRTIMTKINTSRDTNFAQMGDDSTLIEYTGKRSLNFKQFLFQSGCDVNEAVFSEE